MHLKKPVRAANESIMIGDTIDVDILGGMNAGIDQVYVNHLTKEPLMINNQLRHTLFIP